MIDALLKGLALGAILAISVGPVIFTVLKQSIVNGKEGGLSFVAGVWASDALLIFLCNAFSELVHDLMHYQKTIGYIGSLFLMGLGFFYAFFKKTELRKDMEGATPYSFNKNDFAKVCVSGFLINTLNPSVILFWLTSATAFSITNTSHERLIIFGTCISLNIAADILKVFLAGKIRSRLTTHNISVINKISGSILIVFGIVLLCGTYLSLGRH